jgi:hypothetical protein
MISGRLILRLFQPPKESPRHNYELDVNGLSYDGARNETSDPRPRARTLDAEMPVRLTMVIRTMGQEVFCAPVLPPSKQQSL